MKIVTPKVQLLAHTKLNRLAISGPYFISNDHLYIPEHLEGMDIQPGSTDAETLVTFAGRSCYQSFHRPSEATYMDANYIQRTLFEQKHWSIAEHVTATVYLTGVSRSFLAEITRHRHLSFSVQSQRFVDESDCNVVMPPAIRNADHDRQSTWLTDMDIAIGAYENHAAELSAILPRKQAREAARSVLPNAVETRMVITGNLRAWKEIIDRRTAPDADAEMQEVAGLIRDAIHPIAPNIITKEG